MKRSTLRWTLVAAVSVIINVSAGRYARAAILSGSHPAAAETPTALGDADPAQPLTMEIRFALRNTAELERLLAEQQKPASAKYHQWLKTGEFDRRFGPRPSDVKAVADWLRSEGFTVESASDGVVEFSGNVGQAQRTFATRIARFGDGSIYANVEDPTIPAQFGGVIAAIRGLDNMMRIKPAGLHLTPPMPSSLDALKAQIFGSNHNVGTQIANSQTQAVSTDPLAVVDGIEAFGPQDMQTFYDENLQSGGDGSGSCVALVGTSEVSTAALDAFDSQFGLPAINLTETVQGANPGQTGDDKEIEAELDVEWSHAIAPGATQTLFVAASSAADPLADDITNAVKANKCDVISISFSYCGAPSTEFTNVLDPLFQKAASQGQSVFVSSGDEGAAALDSECNVTGSRGVNEMSADPNVTSVGGTQSNPIYSNAGNDVGYTQESTWNSSNASSGQGASGGGESGIFAKPSYQTGPGVPDDVNRDVPDVALLASPLAPGVFFGDAVTTSPPQVVCCIGGTSLAAPMMAGFVEIIDQQIGRLGRMNDTFYKLANQQFGSQTTDNGFHDITIGNNNFDGVIGYNAGPGYDQTTGWGSIDFDIFAAAVKSNQPAVETTMVPSPAQINFGNLDASATGKSHKVTIVNKGKTDAIVGTVTAPAVFMIVPGSDLCSNQTIAAKKSCSISVQFCPSAPGAASGSVTIPYNGASPATVSVSGNGTAVSLNAPKSMTFAPVAAGSPSKPKSLTISNPSTATVQLGAASLSGPYSMESDTCSDATVGPKGHCVIALDFAPPPGSAGATSMPGSLNFGYTYGSNDGSMTVSLSGTVK